MRTIVKKVLNRILDIFYPRFCLVCNKNYSDKNFNYDYICIECENKLPKPGNKNICLKCKTFLGEYTLSKPICQQCKKYRHLFKKLITPLYYKDEAEELIKEFKFGKRFYIGKFLTEMLWKTIKIEISDYRNRIHYITYVPMTYKEKYKRGFNQTEFIAKLVGKSLNIPVVKLLKKIKSTKHQMELNFYERQRNIKDAFAINEKYGDLIKGRNIIIVDDIYTTGATIAECCKVFKEKGVRQIFPCVLGRTS